MREIKFRAWDGKIMWNSYSFDEEGSLCTNIDYCNGPEGKSDNIIQMQYTGLKDKNGKKIYEHDVIQFLRKDRNKRTYSGPWNGVILWHLDASWRASNIVDPDDYIKLGSYWTKNVEVIGNIYQNPEFIK